MGAASPRAPDGQRQAPPSWPCPSLAPEHAHLHVLVVCRALPLPPFLRSPYMEMTKLLFLGPAI